MEFGFESVGEQLNAVHLRAALGEAMRLAGEVNKYLDQAAPWFEIKEDKEAAATTVHTALQAINGLKVLLAPFLPFTSERLHSFLGYDEPLFGEQFVDSLEDSLGTHHTLRYRPEKASGRWETGELTPGQKLRSPEPLFRKLEASIVEEERGRLGK